MKTKLLALALAGTGLFALPALGLAQNASGFFINGNIGQANLDKGAYNDDDTGYAANFGYRWAVAPNVLIGVEGGYADLGSFGPRSTYAGVDLGDARVKGWNIGANTHINLTDNWYVSGRAGYFRADVRGTYINSVQNSPGGEPLYVVTGVNDTGNKWYGGVGFGYDFNNNFSVGLNYDYYKANVRGLDFNPDLVSVSAEYRF
ncbi:MAG: porin family protein [Xanthomonadales bacterium]|nr:porin family protein [Xanthomonadales bacterium]